MRKTTTHKSIIKKLCTYAIAFLLVLSNFTSLINADEVIQDSVATEEQVTYGSLDDKTQSEVNESNEYSGEDSDQGKNLEEDENVDEEKAIEEDTDETDNDGLEISDELKPEAVRQIKVKLPTVNPVLYDYTTISGANLAKARVNKKIVIATVHVTLKGEDGTEKANLSVTPKSGTTWKVDLPEGVKVAKGDTVTVYQQIGEDKSREVTKDAQPSKASTVTLTMPSGEIWIEQYVSNIVNADEKNEAIDLLKKANPTIAKDIKSVEFKITGIDSKTASYKVTYTDNSKSEEIQAPNLTIKKVTDTSRSPEIDSITIVDNVVKGKLAGPGPFDGIKVQLILKVNKDKAGQYCNENKCTVDKTSSTPVGVKLQGDGTFSYTLQKWDRLELDQIVGVSVKEPHKFVSCSTTTVKPLIPEKTEVKDPRKLTAEDKKTIDAAIKTAYTVNGVSKLPNGTGYYEEVPAVIQIDDSGNVKIFSGNDVAGTWNIEGTFVPGTNADGSVKLKEGVEPTITIPAKDLLKNIKPEKPAFKVEGDNVIITPDKVDTDAKTIAVSYKDKENKDQKIIATKADDGTWSITEGEGTVDANGVITLPKSKVKGGTDITATVTDKGGIADGDTTPLTSDSVTLTVEETKTFKVTVQANGGTGDDKVETKKSGEKYTLPKGDTFTPPENKEFAGWLVGDTTTTTEPGTEITITGDTVIKASWKPIMVDVSFDKGEGSGNKDKVSVAKGSQYTLPNSDGFTPPENQEFDGWVVNGEDKKVGDKITVNENTTVTAKYKPIMVDVSFDKGEGSGEKAKVSVAKGSEYTLPNSDGFTAPANQKFKGWKIGETEYQPGA